MLLLSCLGEIVVIFVEQVEVNIKAEANFHRGD